MIPRFSDRSGLLITEKQRNKQFEYNRNKQLVSDVIRVYRCTWKESHSVLKSLCVLNFALPDGGVNLFVETGYTCVQALIIIMNCRRTS